MSLQCCLRPAISSSYTTQPLYSNGSYQPRLTHSSRARPRSCHPTVRRTAAQRVDPPTQRLLTCCLCVRCCCCCVYLCRDMNGPHGPTEICALALSPNRRSASAVGHPTAVDADAVAGADCVCDCVWCGVVVRRFVAVSEVGATSPVVSIFDVRSLRRRRLFASPAMAQACVASQAAPFRSLVALAFSQDSRHLAAVSGGPEPIALEWQWQKEQLTACGLVRAVPNPRTLSYHPTDAALLMVSGVGGFSLLQVDWDSATITAAQPSAPSTASSHDTGAPQWTEVEAAAVPVDVGALDLTCHAWLDGDRCLLGARQGLLLIAQQGRIHSTLSVHSGGGAEEEGSAVPAAFHPAKAVHSLCVFPGGGPVAVGCDGGVVQLYTQRSSAADTAAASPSSAAFPLQVDACHLLPYQPAPVVHVTLSPSLSDVLAITDTSQAFRITQPTSQPTGQPLHPAQQLHSTTGGVSSRPQSGAVSAPPRSVTPLLSLHHSGPITGLSLCVRKPLAATCGADRSIRLWNLLTLQCELVVYFPEVPLSVSFHPSGLHLLVGFSDKLRLCNVLSHEIRAFKELPIKSCAECAFSHGGAAFACVNGTLIQVYDTYTGEQLAVFRGHTGPVRSLAWSADDLRLVSAGSDGAVYQRRLSSASRMQELVQKGCKFTCALVTEHDRLYAVGDDRLLKEIVERSVHKTLDAGCVLTYIAVDHQQPTSRLIAGTDNGVVRSFAFPLTGVVKDYQCHSRAVTRLAISHDDRFVVSASEDGSLALFNASKPSGPQATGAAAPLSSAEPGSLLTLPIPLSSSAALASPECVAWSDDVLVSRASLDESSHLLLELRGRVDELSASNEYQLRLHEMNYSEKVKEVGEKYALQLEHDRSKVELLVDEKTEMETECADKLRQMREQHTQRLHAEDRAHQQTLLQQIADYAQLQDQLEEQQRSCASGLQRVEEEHRREMERLQCEWQLRVDAASAQLSVQQRAVERVRVEYAESKAQSCSDQDAELEAVKAGYSGRLLAERDSLLRFKGELGIMKKKLSALHKDIEEQKELLKQSTEREDTLRHSIGLLEGRIAQQRSSMREKDRLIGHSERAISELKKDNGELEKFKFVLDHQIKQLKRQIEPREAEIGQLRSDMTGIDQLLERDHSHNAALAHDIQQLKQSNGQLQADIHSSRDHSRRLQRRMQHAKAALTLSAQHLDDVQHIARTLALCVQHAQQRSSPAHGSGSAAAASLLHPAGLSRAAQRPNHSHSHTAAATSVVSSASSPSSSSFPSSAASPGSVLLELGRHRAALLHRVAELSEQLSARWREGRKGTVAVMQSNVQLIKEIQSTRRRHHQQQQRGRGPTRTAATEAQAQAKQSREEEGKSGSRVGQQLREEKLQEEVAQEELQEEEEEEATSEEAAAALLSRQRAHIVRLREQILALTGAA